MWLPLSLFSYGFSLAIQMASAMPRGNQSFSLHLTVTASGAKLYTHMFTDRGTPLLVFFESFRIIRCIRLWNLVLGDIILSFRSRFRLKVVSLT